VDVGADQLAHRVGRGRAGQHGALEHAEHEGVEVLQRPQHREPDPRPGGEHAEVRRHRHGEGRGGPAAAPASPPVGPAPQLVGEAARRSVGLRVHPDEASREGVSVVPVRGTAPA
jgi:hypothetical protein